ncbi:hypothetical protein ACF1GS_29430 [Streptomyces eurythermus]|uniref:hypothetical protein n=1 Tax=Streptomyces eurythermus TaxID=42237 RepID=UPI0036FE06DC
MRVVGTSRRHHAGSDAARLRRIPGVLALAGVVLLAACSGPSPDDAHDSHGPSAPSLKSLGTAVKQTKVLHWSGSWRLYHRDEYGGLTDESSTVVTADLRAMGDGDVFGTLTADGVHTQVMLISGLALFVKDDRAKHRAVGDKNPRSPAGRWMKINRPNSFSDVLGLKLSWLSPSSLGSLLASSTADGTGEATGTSLPARSSVARRFPRPPGVPADAVPVTFAGDDGTGPGVYWVSSGAPLRLLGYSGLDVRYDSHAEPYERLPDSAAAKLSARMENASAARTTYAALRTAVRSLPSTVPVSDILSEKAVSVSTSDAQCGPLCHTATVAVTLTNDMPQESVTALYEVRLTAREPFGRSLDEMDLGSCTVRLPTARPGATVRGACTVSGAELRKAVDEATDEHGFVHLWFATRASRLDSDITGPSHSEDVLKRVDSDAVAALGTG